MSNYEQKVKLFHEKYGFAISAELTADKELAIYSQQLLKMSQNLTTGTLPAVRSHLIIEEVAELLKAFSEGDKIEILDALADLIYVVTGTAVTFGLPLDAAFNEVHRSNMTKQIKQDRLQHPGKGSNYSPPSFSNLM